MKELLEWIKEEKYFLNSRGQWYSVLNRGIYDKPSPVFTNEQLIERYEFQRLNKALPGC